MLGLERGATLPLTAIIHWHIQWDDRSARLVSVNLNGCQCIPIRWIISSTNLAPQDVHSINQIYRSIHPFLATESSICRICRPWKSLAFFKHLLSDNSEFQQLTLYTPTFTCSKLHPSSKICSVFKETSFVDREPVSDSRNSERYITRGLGSNSKVQLLKHDMTIYCET